MTSSDQNIKPTNVFLITCDSLSMLTFYYKTLNQLYRTVKKNMLMCKSQTYVRDHVKQIKKYVDVQIPNVRNHDKQIKKIC